MAVPAPPPKEGGSSGLPRVAVLMATYNGAPWLREQLASILSCKDVAARVFISDDGSTDETLKIARACGEGVVVLPAKRSGGAAQNFIRLVLDAPWDGFDHVALSDQDDLWRPQKLARAAARIGAEGLDAYSSDVTAFWSDGRTRDIVKSRPQRGWDHLFESAGPGSTFVFPLASAEFLRSRLREIGPEKLARIGLHDWLFYAIFREAGKRWLIDDEPGLYYRQHTSNVLGASTGANAAFSRLRRLRDSWYRHQILAVADAVGADNPVIRHVRHPAIGAAALRHFRSCRRRPRDAAVLLAYLMALPLFARRTA